MEPRVTTFTIMSVRMPDGTTSSITSKVTESVDSALDHLRAMSRQWEGVEPVCYASAGSRWTWERRNHLGHVAYTDTVRIYRGAGHE